MGQQPCPINHLILLCMENRSFDHFLGHLALEEPPRDDIDGLAEPPRTNDNLAGDPVANWNMDGIAPTFPDVPHHLPDAQSDYNGGHNDGFVTTYQKAHPDQPAFANIPMGYYTRETASVLYALADRFTVFDGWYASMLSSTWPNRKYLHSGKRDSDKDTQTVPGISGFQTDPIYDTIAKASDPTTGKPLTWRCYFTDVPFLGFWYRFAFNNAQMFETIECFARDCTNGTLPSVSIIDPPFTLADDHPPHDPLLGEKFIGLVVDALTNSVSWHDSALLIVYDEYGGFYDHVSPPPAPEPDAEDSPLGFRVPAILVSPYAKQKYVVSRKNGGLYDHTSWMRSISERWNCEFDDTIGARWKYVRSLWDDAFNFNAEPLPCGTYTGEKIIHMTWGFGVRERLDSPLGHFEAALERIFVLPELKALDRRALTFETLGKFEHAVITLKRSTDYQRAPTG
jgi:phospholipase C